MVPHTVSYPGAKFAVTRNLSVHTESKNATWHNYSPLEHIWYLVYSSHLVMVWLGHSVKPGFLWHIIFLFSLKAKCLHNTPQWLPMATCLMCSYFNFWTNQNLLWAGQISVVELAHFQFIIWSLKWIDHKAQKVELVCLSVCLSVCQQGL